MNSANASQAGPGVASQAHIWARLRDWVAKQEAYELEHNRPAPLSPPVVKALSVLIPLQHQKELEVGNDDYVSSLMRFIQGRHLPIPVFQDHGPVNGTSTNGTAQIKWGALCQLSFTDVGAFPCEGYGIEDGECFPVFQSKKNAKQFAAKHALQYLTEKYANPETGKRQRAIKDIPSLPSPLSKRAEIRWNKDTAETISSNKSVRSVEHMTHPDGSSIFARVNLLANSLGFDQPTYAIQQDSDLKNFFSGHAEFSVGNKNVPVGLGRVQGVLGKAEAKFQVAEGVLVWLREEEGRRRDAMNKVFFANRIDPPLEEGVPIKET